MISKDCRPTGGVPKWKDYAAADCLLANEDGRLVSTAAAGVVLTQKHRRAQLISECMFVFNSMVLRARLYHGQDAGPFGP